jgi:ribose 5-phosphate isomerase B
MRIILATDHAGFELKERIKDFLIAEGIETEDAGAYEYDETDDYPPYIAAAAAEVSQDPEGTRAIILGGSGQGEAMVANRFPNVRATVYYGDPIESDDKPLLSFFGGKDGPDAYELVRLSREHNDANVLSLGARFVAPDDALEAVSVWLTTEYSGEERHERRIQQIELLFAEPQESEEEAPLEDVESEDNETATP